MHVRRVNRAQSIRMPVIDNQFSAIYVFDRIHVHRHDSLIKLLRGSVAILNHAVFGRHLEAEVWRQIRAPQK